MNQERGLIQLGELPLIAWHADRSVTAALHTLAAKRTAVDVIIHHEALGFAVQHGDLDGFGRAVHGAQSASGARLHRHVQRATQLQRRIRVLDRIGFGDGPAEERSQHVREHGSNRHKAISIPGS